MILSAGALEQLLRQYWAVVALASVLTTVLLRQLILLNSVNEIKNLGKDLYREIARHYLRRALAGWLLIFSACAVAFWVLSFYAGSVYISRREGALAAVILFLSGVLSHLQALHISTVSVLRDRGEMERAF